VATGERPVALVGLSGAGKSAVARALGDRLGCPVADLDDELAAVYGASIPRLFERHGEAWFRERELEALAAAVSRAGVIACGGGIVTLESSRALLATRCRVAWLEVSVGEALRRLEPAIASRPLLAGHDPGARLAGMLETRWALYAAVAHVRVTTDDRTPADIATDVLSAFEALPR
jgi:shikimate kinase